MSKYHNGVVGVGDPVEISEFEIKNMRGDYRISWVPATVAAVHPQLVVVFADSTRMVLRSAGEFRVPRWAKERAA